MRQLILSVGITVLTGTLLFVYFRNKMNSIDKKLNLVFDTIQEHNKHMDSIPPPGVVLQGMPPGMMPPGMMPPDMVNDNPEIELIKQKIMSNNQKIQDELDKLNNSNLIDVSDSENKLGEFDSSDDDSDDDDCDDDDDNDSDDDSDDDDDKENEETKENEENEENKEEKVDNDEKGDDLVNLEVVNVEENNKSNVNYGKFTKAQLREICEENNLSGWKSLNKTKLVAFLEEQMQ